MQCGILEKTLEQKKIAWLVEKLDKSKKSLESS